MKRAIVVDAVWAGSPRATPDATVDVVPSWRDTLGDRIFTLGRQDVGIAAALLVANLNSTRGGLGPLVSPTTKAIAIAAALATAIALSVTTRIVITGAQARWTLAVSAFVVAVGASSVLFHLPAQRLLLLGQFMAITFCVLVHVITRPGRMFGVMFWVSGLHIVLALTTGVSTAWNEGASRLSGGAHPIQLGFEAGVVVLVCLVIVASRSDGIGLRLFACGLGVTALVALDGAFSRQSLIGVSVAVIGALGLWPGKYRLYRFFTLAVIGTYAAALTDLTAIPRLIGETDASGLIQATGRLVIWDRLLASNLDIGLLGYGFASLSDPFGPDSRLYAASLGHEAENALLQVLLNGGVAGLLAWSMIVLTTIQLVWRSHPETRTAGMILMPVFAASAWASSGLSGQGLQWWWLLAIGDLALRGAQGSVVIDRVTVGGAVQEGT